MLFTFLITGTDSHNNTAERAIRPNVIIRKITNGHRTIHGADSHKILMSVKETCRLRELNFHKVIIKIIPDNPRFNCSYKVLFINIQYPIHF